MENTVKTNNTEAYNYNLGIGPFSFTSQGKLSEDITAKNLSNLLSCLDTPETKDEAVKSSFGYSFQRGTEMLQVRLNRVFNFVFGDHNWYNEDRAVSLIKHFMKNEAKDIKSEINAKNVLEVFTRLKEISPNDVEGIKEKKLQKLANNLDFFEEVRLVYDDITDSPQGKAVIAKGKEVAKEAGIKVAEFGVQLLFNYIGSIFSPAAAEETAPLNPNRVKALPAPVAKPAGSLLLIGN